MVFKELINAAVSADVWLITLNTLKITGTATLLAAVTGMACAFILAFYNVPFKRFITPLLNTGMAMPPVVAGLFISLVFWRSGIFGSLNLLYTPEAMIIAEYLLAFPIITALSLSALQSVKPEIKEQLHVLGASKRQLITGVFKESRLMAGAAVIAAYGAIVSEVGAALMVGGNIKGETRVLTTAITLETRKGNFETALALGIILLVLALSVNIVMTYIQQKENVWQIKR